MGALKVWDSVAAAWKYVNSLLTVRDESNSQSDTNALDLRFPDGTVVALGSGVVRIREVPAGAVGCSVYNNGTNSIANTTSVPLTFDSEDFDTDGFHSTSVNTDRITIPAGLGGTYLVLGTVGRWDANSTGQREYWVRKNGGTALPGEVYLDATVMTSRGVPAIASIVKLVAGDYLQLVVYQNSGGTRTVGFAGTNREAGNTLAVYRLDPGGTIGEAIGAGASGANQSLTDGVSAALAMATENWDTDGFHAASGSLFTIPAGLGGKYLVWADIEFATHATGQRFSYLVPSAGGPAVYHSSTASGDVVRHSLAGVMNLAAGATVTVQAYQNSGGALNAKVINAGVQLLATAGIPRGYREGTAFPSGPTSGDYFRRTDIAGGMLFKWDGTRWLSDQLFEMQLSVFSSVGDLPLTVSGNDVARAAGVDLYGASSVWVERYKVAFYVDGGTALSASHKWVGTFKTYPAGTVFFTGPSIDSGASTAWRFVSGDVDVAVAYSTEGLTSVSWTKTGTPGNLYTYTTLYYRLIAT